MGMEQAPDTKEKSAESIIGMVSGPLPKYGLLQDANLCEKIEKSTKNETSGKFFNAIDGSVIPW